MTRIEHTVIVEGQTVLLFNELKGKKLLTIEIDGYGVGKIITSGSSLPSGKEVKFTSGISNGILLFGTPLTRGSKIIIKYEN